jgi:5-methylcytosine-specific restriction protein A
VPRAAKHACAEFPCGELVEEGSSRCSFHAELADKRRGTARERGYTARWARRSKRFRDRFPLCGQRPNHQPPVYSRCFDEHRTTAAAHVDHVIPHRGDERLMWDEINNWQSLCRQCHTRKTNAGL